MHQLNKSTPKMRTAFTPRVKSSQNLRTSQQKHFLTPNQKNLQPRTSMNPQNIEQQISKKLISPNQPLKVGKIDIANLNTDTDSPIKYNPFFSNAAKNKNHQNKKKNEKNAFRDLQWPSNQQKNFDFDLQKTVNSGKITRCMSAQTFRSGVSSKSEKSNRIKENRKQFNEKFNVALDFLLTKNSDYLNQKMNMCNQKARPKQKIFSVMRPSINTTNKDFYKKNEDKHKLDIQPQNQKVSIPLSESKVCGNSTSHQFHKGSPEKRPEKAEWNEGFKLQGPIYQATTYSNAFPNHGQFKKMVPIAVWNQHPLGMKHKDTTTNSRHFKGEFRSRSQLATWNNLNPVANDLFDGKKSTMYESFYGKKERQPIQQWPMADHKLLTTNGMFNTEMRSSMVNFSSHELHFENKCDCGRKKH